MKRTPIFFLIIVLLPLITIAGEKKRAPEFSLKTMEGKTVQMSALRGKVVVVNFWATWCGPCRYEIPDFVSIYGTHREKGLEIVGIALDQGGWEVVRPFLGQNRIPYPVVLGDQKEALKWGRFEYIPTTFIVDKNGYIVDTHVGRLTRDALLKKITPLL